MRACLHQLSYLVNPFNKTSRATREIELTEKCLRCASALGKKLLSLLSELGNFDNVCRFWYRHYEPAGSRTRVTPPIPTTRYFGFYFKSCFRPLLIFWLTLSPQTFASIFSIFSTEKFKMGSTFLRHQRQRWSCGPDVCVLFPHKNLNRHFFFVSREDLARSEFRW